MFRLEKECFGVDDQVIGCRT